MMSPWLLALGLPVGLALLLLVRSPLRPLALSLAPAAGVPALALALLAPLAEGVYLPWLLLGTRLGLDDAGRVFLFFTALLWTAAGIFAHSYLARDQLHHRFSFFFLLAMGGNLGLTVALDAVSFYLFFALMTFAAFGVIVHQGSPLARRAAIVYVSMAVLGEAFLLAGLLLAVTAAGGFTELSLVAATIATAPGRDLIIALFLIGFGVKAGAIPLHLWLPLAHPVAPTPASAVLSGAMIKAGLLGWIRFLPLGEAALPGWAGFCLAMGIIAAFYGVAMGLAQRDPKTNLAYSSISQMGIMTMALGIGLVDPGASLPAMGAVLLLALHHAFAKGALFLGIGIATSNPPAGWQRRLLMGGLGLSALSLAGAPLTAGATAKALLKAVSPMAPGQWPQWLDWLLPVTSVATTLLLGRFLWLVWTQMRQEPARGCTSGLWLPWLLLIGSVVGAAWLVPVHRAPEIVDAQLLSAAALWVAGWPIIAGIALLWNIRHLDRRTRRAGQITLPAGDLVVVVEWFLWEVGSLWRSYLEPAASRLAADLAVKGAGLPNGLAQGRIMERLEARLVRWDTAGGLFLLLIVATVVVLSLT